MVNIQLSLNNSIIIGGCNNNNKPSNESPSAYNKSESKIKKMKSRMPNENNTNFILL